MSINVYSILYFITTLVSLVTLVLLWSRRKAPGVALLCWLMALVAWWSLAGGLESAALTLAGKIFWSQASYLGFTQVIPLYLVFVLAYTGRQNKLSPSRLLLLWLPSLLTLGLAWTNSYHGWIWSGYQPGSAEANTIIYLHGFWYWLFVAWVYLAVSASGLLLLYDYLRAAPPFRRQAAALALSALPPLAGGMIYAFNLNPVPYLDWTPISFSLTGMILTWSLARYKLFDLRPALHEAVLGAMLDGVAVLDSQGRILELNPALVEILRAETGLEIRRPANLVGAGWRDLPLPPLAEWEFIDPPQALSDLTGIFGQPVTLTADLQLKPGSTRWYNLRLSPLIDPRRGWLGHLLYLTEITPRKKLEREMTEMNAGLERLVAERTAELDQSRQVLIQRLTDQSRRLAALYDVMLVGNRALDLQDTLQVSLEKTRAALQADAVVVFQRDPACDRLRLLAQCGLGPEGAHCLQDLPAGWLADGAGPQVEPNLDLASALPAGLRRELPGGALLCQRIGEGAEDLVLCGLWRSPRDFPIEEISMFSAVVELMNAILEITRLRQQIAQTATLQERRRLARDLHDSVTQSLHSLVFSADTARHLAETGQPAQLDKALVHLGQSARLALKEMRLLLYELRLASLEEIDLVEALTARLDAVERRSGVDARLEIEGPRPWPKEWEQELYPLVMEALNNSLKHARAGQVWVMITSREDEFCLEVGDNGSGFEPAEVDGVGMGLGTMNERAERLGGRLELLAHSGQGAILRVRIPHIQPLTPL